MSAETMALYGPGSRIDGWPNARRNTPLPGSKERLEAGLERLHRLWRDMVARYVDLLDAETLDADFEPSLSGFGGAWTAGSRDDREADYLHGRTSDEEPMQGWTECQSRCGKFGAGYALEDDENSLGSIGGTATSNDPWMPRDNGRLTRGSPSQVHWASGKPDDYEEQCEGGGGDDACEDEGAQSLTQKPTYARAA